MRARKIIKVGILPYKAIKARTIAIAAGSIKPGRDDPKVWFPSCAPSRASFPKRMRPCFQRSAGPARHH